MYYLNIFLFIHHAEYVNTTQCISIYQTIQIVLKPSNSENSEGDGGKEDVYSQMVTNPLRCNCKNCVTVPTTLDGSWKIKLNYSKKKKKRALLKIKNGFAHSNQYAK